MALSRTFPRSVGALAALGLSALSLGSGTGCSTTVRDFDSTTGSSQGGGGTGGTGSAGSGTGGAAGSSGTAGAGGTGGTGGSAPLACMPGMPPYAGPLCGPPSLPCTVLADELVNDPHFRNDAPSIAINGDCRPEIAYTVAEQGFHGFHAVRDAPDTWTATPTPFELQTGALAIAPDGNSFLLGNAGQFWMRSQGQWFELAAIPTPNVVVGARSLALDGAGNLHAGFWEYMNYGLYYAVHASGWTVNPMPVSVSQRFPIAVSSTGRAHFTYWRSTMIWELQWATPPDAAEVVDSIGNSLSISATGIAVGPPDAGNPNGRPHILYGYVPPGSNMVQIKYATRNGPTFWDRIVIDTDDLPGAQPCNQLPQIEGETCAYNFLEVRPLGLVTDATGDVRVFYSKVNRMGTYTATCFGPPPSQCYWTPLDDQSTGDLMVAWLEPNQTVGKAAVTGNFSSFGATMVLDTIGRIHVAAHAREPSVPADPAVRYLLLGP